VTERGWLAGTNPEGMRHFIESPRRRPDQRRLRLLRTALCDTLLARSTAEPKVAALEKLIATLEDPTPRSVEHWQTCSAVALREAERLEYQSVLSYREAINLVTNPPTSDLSPRQVPARGQEGEWGKVRAANAQVYLIRSLEHALIDLDGNTLDQMVYCCRHANCAFADAKYLGELASCSPNQVDDEPQQIRPGRTEIQQAATKEIGRVFQDLFGNPFRRVAFDPRWQTADVIGLARGIYDDRAFERMPLLGDALMDAGCADECVISHCREAGAHYRGCWVVDALLGLDTVPATK
jgi:hypothetical protein